MGPKIALVGAGGMSFGPVMTYDILKSEALHGGTLMLIDMAQDKLDHARATADKLNDQLGNPITIEGETSLARGLEGAEYVLVSAEKGRWQHWTEDYEIPRKYGSPQVMGENGGPGAVFHSLRSITNVLSICKEVENVVPEAFLINLTNPMSRVTLAINRGTKLKNVGLCHEFLGGIMRIAKNLLIPPSKIEAKASGMNHFTWFYEINNADTGEDLYPKLRKHFKLFPFLYSPLVRYCFDKFDLFPTTSDSHLAEYLPFSPDHVKPLIPFHSFFEHEGAIRYKLTELYGKGLIPIPAKILPLSGEEAIPIITALHTREYEEFNAINVPNKGYIPNLPDDTMVEVPATAQGGELVPSQVPEIAECLAEYIRPQFEIQSLIVDSALQKDPELAFEALKADPLAPPSTDACRRMFDEMIKLQADLLPF